MSLGSAWTAQSSRVAWATAYDPAFKNKGRERKTHSEMGSPHPSISSFLYKRGKLWVSDLPASVIKATTGDELWAHYLCSGSVYKFPKGFPLCNG